MRLIDADEFAGKLKGLKEHVDKISINRESRCLVDVTQVIEYVENAPTVEAVRLDESCDDCPLYVHDKQNCPRFNKVIPETIAEAVQGWRTGKPTENGQYMVTLEAWGHHYIEVFHYGKPLMPNRFGENVCWYRCDDEYGDVVYDDNDILAWMPLPTPYKGGDDE